MHRTSPAGDLPGVLAERIAATQSALTGNLERLAQATERLDETRRSVENGRSEREVLHDMAYARLMARLHSMPVIEQAKGILMAQSRCSPDEAFTMLRAASQRSNVKVRDLAQEIVDRVSGRQSQPPADELSSAG